MSEANKNVACKWFEEVWNKQRREAIAELLSPDAVLHEGADDMRGPEGFYPFFDRMQQSFSEIHVTVHDAIAEGDRVCARWSCSMRHTGEGFEIAPTNRTAVATGMSILRVSDGKLVEGWQNWDMLGLMRQLTDGAAGPTYVAYVGA